MSSPVVAATVVFGGLRWGFLAFFPSFPCRGFSSSLHTRLCAWMGRPSWHPWQAGFCRHLLVSNTPWNVTRAIARWPLDFRLGVTYFVKQPPNCHLLRLNPRPIRFILLEERTSYPIIIIIIIMATGTDFPDLLPLLVPISHRFRQVFHVTSSISTAFLLINSSWSPSIYKWVYVCACARIAYWLSS